jgi:hypothetical protein
MPVKAKEVGKWNEVILLISWGGYFYDKVFITTKWKNGPLSTFFSSKFAKRMVWRGRTDVKKTVW